MVDYRPRQVRSWYRYSFLLLAVGYSHQIDQSSAFQLIPRLVSRHISQSPVINCLTPNEQRVCKRQGLELSSCPVLDAIDATRTSKDNADAVTSITPTVEESGKKKKKKQATTTPKLLGRASGLGFLIASLRGKPHMYLQRLQKKHGDNFIVRPNIVVLNDPKAIRDVLETHNLPKTPKVRFGYKSIFYGTKSRRSSGGILAAPWKKWLEQRRMAAPALAESMIGSLAPKFYEVSLPLFAYLDSMAISNKPVDMSAAFTAVTMDAIGTILLGKSFGMCRQLHLERKKGAEVPFASALHRLTDEAVRQMVLPGWWLRRRPKDDEVEAARKVIDDFLEDCIEARVAEHAKAHANANTLDEDGKQDDSTTDLLNILLEAEANGVMRHDEVKGQLLQFVFAGFDTLAPTLTYMLWEVSQNPTLASDLAAEAKVAMPSKYDFPWKPDVLAHQLPLMDRTFSETNRKHPAAAMGTSRNVGRKALVVGDGIELPGGTSVLIPPWTLHRNERFWPDPETFDPSRFEGSPSDPYAYQPFSGGPRNCIGSKLARAETLSLFAPLLRRYKIHCDTTKVPDDRFSLTRRPRKEVMFTLTQRPE